MKRILVLGLVLSTAVLALPGCSGGGGDDGVKSDVAKQMSDASSIAKDANGDYSKLTPEQKKIFLDMANNNEKQASDLVHMMAHPPNEQYLNKAKK